MSFARHHAYRLLRRADIRAALIERKEKAAMGNEAESGTDSATLTRALHASLRDYMVTGADGERRFDLARLAGDQMVSELAVDIREAGTTPAGVPVPAGTRLRFKLTNKPAAARERARDSGDATPRGDAALAQGLHPVTGEPITDDHRAKALYHLIEKAKLNPDGIEPHAAVNPATGQPLTHRERAAAVLDLLARVAERDGAGHDDAARARPDRGDAPAGDGWEAFEAQVRRDLGLPARGTATHPVDPVSQPAPGEREQP